MASCTPTALHAAAPPAAAVAALLLVLRDAGFCVQANLACCFMLSETGSHQYCWTADQVRAVVHALGVGAVQRLAQTRANISSLDRHSEVHEAVISWQTSGILCSQGTGFRVCVLALAYDTEVCFWLVVKALVDGPLGDLRVCRIQFATRELAYEFAEAIACTKCLLSIINRSGNKDLLGRQQRCPPVLLFCSAHSWCSWPDRPKAA
jgi:hypothetical protein